MAITRVQAPSPSNATAVESIALSWTSTTTSGNLLLGILQARENIHDIIAPTGMTLLIEQVTGTSERQFVYYEPNCSARSGSQTFSFSQAGGSDCTMHLVEYSGLQTVSPLDVTATNTGTSLNPDSGTTATTAVTEELWFAALCNRNVPTQSSPTNGFTQVNRTHSSNASAGTQLEGAIYEKIVSATGTANVSATMSGSTARNWGGVIVTLKGTTGTVQVTPGAITWAGQTVSAFTSTVQVTPGAVTWTGQTVNLVITGTTIVTVSVVGAVTWTGQTVTAEGIEGPPPPPVVDHRSEGGWPRDSRQKRFLYYRPPFTNVDPGRDE